MEEVSRLYEPGLVRVSRCLRSVPEIELGKDALDVCLHRPFADDEGFGDFGVGVSSGDEPEDLLFATCERCEPGQFWCRAPFGKDRLRLANWSVEPSIRTAGRWAYVFRDQRDLLRP